MTQQVPPHAAQLMADMRAVMQDLGESEMGIMMPDPDDSSKEVESAVSCLARDHGHERISGDVAAYSGERARIATVLAFAADMPVDLRRGDAVNLFGEEWQVRSVRRHGFGQGQVLRLTLTAEEHTRGGNRA